MSRRFDTVAVLGVGLLGGSLGLALKARGMAGRIRGLGRNASSLDTALKLGAIDDASLDLEETVRDARLVVVCTPATAITGYLDRLLPVIGPETVVTDVASTKSLICRHAEQTWPRPLRFVGSHPMAGSEKSGPEHARPDLYAGCVALVAESDAADADAREAVADLWTGVGASVVTLRPEVHDAILARTSHVPHVLASCIAAVASRMEDVRPMVGQGFKDFTRIAGSRPEIWRDICLTNREGISACLEEVEAALASVRRAVLEEDGEALEEFFRAGRRAREEVIGP